MATAPPASTSSGGRFQFALGAGAFCEAVEAMGGPRSPGEAVDALTEAIEVIRRSRLRPAQNPVPQMQRFEAEVAPVVRERVAQDRDGDPPV